MSKKKRITFIIVWLLLIAAITAGVFLTSPAKGEESIQTTMRDAVLHGTNKIDFFGIEVNPAMISAISVTAILLIAAAIIRIVAIPRFKTVPGKFQAVIESAVEFFDNLAKTNSPHRNTFLGAYIFSAGTYIFIGTLFALTGFEAITTQGMPMSLPAPLSDINAAIMLGCLSYLVILSGGIVGNGIRGIGRTLKDFSLPISMSFRLFGALLSGALVTELVYHYISLSFILPVVVAVLFTLLHALIQTYVLTMLTALFYGEVSEPSEKKKKREKHKKTGENSPYNPKPTNELYESIEEKG